MTNDIHIFYKMDKTPGWLLNYIVIGVECHDATVLQAVQAKLQRNQRDIKNSTAYVMAVIFNTICEAQSDLLVDPYLNGLNGPDG